MEYNVKRLPHGYLVSDKDYEPIAGFSNFEDLAFWLNDKFRIEPYVTPEPAWDKAPDGWIDWKGGEPPAIAKGTPIIVRQRHGVERTTTMGDAFTFNAFWRNDNCEEDIVAYKVVNDGWIEWKGGKEPDAQVVEVRFADGCIRKDRPGLFYGWDYHHVHSKENPDKCIVAYRVVSP